MGNREGVTHENSEETEQQKSFTTADAVGGKPVDQLIVGTNKQDNRRQEAEGNLLAQGAFGDLNRHNRRCAPYDHQAVEDITANHIANRQAGAAFEGGNHTHCQLGGRGAESDDGQANDQRRDVKAFCDGGRSVSQGIGAYQNKRQSNNKP